jgi:hypothetical protein
MSVQLAVKAHGLKQCNLLVHKATKEFKAKQVHKVLLAPMVLTAHRVTLVLLALMVKME